MFKNIATNKKAIKAGNEFLEKANKIHNNKYDYSKFIYVNNKIKSIVICNEHGEFEQEPSSHLQGSGCGKCYGTHLSNTIEFSLKANKIHNNKYDYSQVEYINNGIKIKIICPEHGVFEQKPKNHLSGQGCHKCSNGISTSLPEQTIFYYLNQLPLKVENRKKIYGVELDIFISELNLGIEYDSKRYHTNEKDIKKQNILHDNKINLIRIREKGLSTINGSHNILRKNKSSQELENIIKDVIIYINLNYNKNYDVDVDLKRDNIEILETIKRNKHLSSIVYTHPHLIEQWHPTKNGSLEPKHFSKGSDQKVWWLCKNEHSYETSISHKTNKKTNCPYCSNKKVCEDNSLASKYSIDIINKFWDCDKNINITPHDVTPNSDKKIWCFTLKGEIRFVEVYYLRKTLDSYIKKLNK